MTTTTIMMLTIMTKIMKMRMRMRMIIYSATRLRRCPHSSVQSHTGHANALFAYMHGHT